MEIKTIITAWQNFNPWLGLIILLAYLIIDGLYAYYTLSVTKGQPIRSATTGALMHFLIAFGVLNYINNFLYIIPLAIGSWIGTYIVVNKERKNNTNDQDT